MSCSVYALSSTTRNYIYVGLSLNAQERISRHQEGRERTTRPYRPFIVLLVEEFGDRPSARAREKQLKSGVGKAYLRELRDVLLNKGA
ncbi:MAG: GIY-YIG nuclease family protein [Flavobacteriales bacterium]|nr:GIY-YIG nuclease family protein [Flavobacteriales bacterium]MCB0810430.1 GIY-YIG nuclease family protein [Flavobacteriales bacterium]